MRLKKFFDNWLYPLTFFAATLVVFIICVAFIGNSKFDLFSLGLVSISLINLLISAGILFWKKKWLQAIVTFIIFCLFSIGFCIVLGMIFFVSVMDEEDHWADNLTIPSDITLQLPVRLEQDNIRPDSILNIDKDTMDFVLYSSFQPGLYEYDFWVRNIEPGTVYIKAFEITANEQLSEDRLGKASSIEVYNPTNNIIRYSTKTNFTIYEGDWGKPYAARFELWLKPEHNKPERKLIQKNYKIEGWMR